ncbi:MAG: hypothetical protein II913_01420 [Elusimicrobiaceae bacterium]|nr:hypothetical protein [Elusimicrobiaceae bacterium]
MSFAAGKGEYREPGLQEKSVRIFTGRRTPSPSEGFLIKKPFFVVVRLLEYLGATAPLRTVYYTNSRLELGLFSLKTLLAFGL